MFLDLTSTDFERGGIYFDDGTLGSGSNRIRTAYIQIDEELKFLPISAETINNEKLEFGIFCYNESKSYLGWSTAWKSFGAMSDIKENTAYIRIVLRYGNDVNIDTNSLSYCKTLSFWNLTASTGLPDFEGMELIPSLTSPRPAALFHISNDTLPYYTHLNIINDLIEPYPAGLFKMKNSELMPYLEGSNLIDSLLRPYPIGLYLIHNETSFPYIDGLNSLIGKNLIKDQNNPIKKISYGDKPSFVIIKDKPVMF